MNTPPSSTPNLEPSADPSAKKRPVRMIVLLLVCFTSLSLVGLQCWSLWTARTTQLLNANVATVNMARALADHADSAFDLVDTVLDGVVASVRAEGIGGYGERLHGQLRAGVTRLPLVDSLAVYNSDGERVLGSALEPVERSSATAQAFFAHHRDLADARPRIGSPFLNRTPRAWLLPVSRRLEHADGSFAGVAVAQVRLEAFRKYYESFSIGNKGMIVLALEGGQLAVQHPFGSSFADSAEVGQDLLLAQWRARGSAGSVSGVGLSDDVIRLYSFRHLNRYPLLVAVALSEQEVLAGWSAGAYMAAAGVLLVLLVMLWMAVRLFRHLDIRDRLEAQLRNAQEGLVTKNRSLKLMARNDGLTGIANRRHFDARLDAEFKRAAREGTSLALVLLDVDHFKKYNDHYGHPAGDACLQFIGQSIRAGRRSSRNLAARIGGEEFAILLPDTDLYGAIAIADAVRKSISSAKREHFGNPAGIVTISCGVHALLPGHAKASPKLLVETADAALYQAKTKGRNCVSPDAVEVALRAHRLPVASP